MMVRRCCASLIYALMPMIALLCSVQMAKANRPCQNYWLTGWHPYPARCGAHQNCVLDFLPSTNLMNWCRASRRFNICNDCGLKNCQHNCAPVWGRLALVRMLLIIRLSVCPAGKKHDYLWRLPRLTRRIF